MCLSGPGKLIIYLVRAVLILESWTGSVLKQTSFSLQGLFPFLLVFMWN